MYAVYSHYWTLLRIYSLSDDSESSNDNRLSPIKTRKNKHTITAKKDTIQSKESTVTTTSHQQPFTLSPKSKKHESPVINESRDPSPETVIDAEQALLAFQTGHKLASLSTKSSTTTTKEKTGDDQESLVVTEGASHEEEVSSPPKKKKRTK